MSDLLDSLDEDFAGAVREWVDGYMDRRGVLDERTRLLISIGQCIARERFDDLAERISRAVESGVEEAEILEVCLQAPIYVGMPVLRPALEVYRDVVGLAGGDSGVAG